jgi:hypothetical protein
MAKKQSTSKATKANSTKQSSTSVTTNSFIKGMNKDVAPSFLQKDQWYHAINAANNSNDGDVGMIGNEPANLQCGVIPYTIIGAIHRYGDEWIIYSTDNINSEIGRFDDSECKYTTLVNDPCLNFNTKNLITGAAKENFDCTWQVYWDDGNNPSRSMNIDDIPWIQDVISPVGDPCIVYEDTTFLDCEKIRLHPLVDTPCIKLSKATDGGSLENGAYQVYIAYTENQQVVTDYIGISNIQTLWSHEGTNSSLDVEFTNLDKDYFYFDLVLLIRTQGQIYTKLIGNYSTESVHVSIDYIDQALTSVGFRELFRQSPLYEKSEAMYVVNDYLIRQGPTEQFDFNYQPIANNITTNYVVNEVSQEYYVNAGNKLGFMRDEIYSFFIRWIYNTGERSASYHIPGRAPQNYTLPNGNSVSETSTVFGDNVIDPAGDQVYKVYNTASVPSNVIEPQDDGSNVIARGQMAYWESTEKYPDKQPEIWGDLCGLPIRHHKMPSEVIGGPNSPLHITDNTDSGIRILGVEFGNIERPKYNDGSYIPNIVGYEILRGSRLGNKSILAKGMFKNMRKYTIPTVDDTIGSGAVGLYPNFPFNDLRPDIYHTQNRKTEGCANGVSGSVSDYAPLTGFTEDVFSFHSPELMFTRPYLNAYETVIYGEISGSSSGKFRPSENHPQFKLLRNISAYLSAIIGVGYAIRNLNGTPDTKALPVQAINNAYPEWKINQQRGGGGNGSANAAVPGAVASNFWNINQRSGGDGDNNEKGSEAETNANNAINDYANAAQGGGLGGFWNDVFDWLSGGAQDIVDSLGLGKSTADRLAEQGLENIEETANSSYGKNGMGLMGGGTQQGVTLDSSESNLSSAFKAFLSFVLAQKNIAVGGQEIIDLIYNLSDYHAHVLKYNSHGFYNKFTSRSLNQTFRAKNNASNYVGSSFQLFDSNKYKINNLFRPTTVAVSTEKPFSSNYNVEDTSRFVLGGYVDSAGVGHNNPNSDFRNLDDSYGGSISALYGALKFNIDNQYGQLDGIRQVQMRGCVEYVDFEKPDAFKYTTKPIFGGDVFIGRYTEKCIMPIFTDFLMGQPNGFPYDYYLRTNIPYPRYWINSRKFDIGSLAQEITTLGLANPAGSTLPNELFYLDRGTGTCSTGFSNAFSGNSLNQAFIMVHAYMYTHVNGINDFYVETEINLPYRDYEEPRERRFYDTYEYNDVNELFHAEIEKFDNFYKYDESLSISKFVTQQTPFAELQPKDYDPLVAEKCFVSYPKRLIYSLKAVEEDRRDYWRQFLYANYKDFKDKVSVIKPFSKSGALVFFPYQSPQLFQGIDTLKTGADLKITIGDGGLFSQPFQNVVNSDLSNEYGSCESLRGVMNTPAGLFYISQAQGKIFQYTPGKGLKAISNSGMKWWFNKYLPSSLIKQFPELETSLLSDNPVVGVGCQVIYDPNDDIVYFMKKDYKVKPEYISNMTFTDEGGFIYKVTTQVSTLSIPVTLGDPVYFDDCSWTVSYDPKASAWISFHDWHPEFALPSINHFFTTKTITSDVPICPPGFEFNPANGLCEELINVTQPATVTVDEVAATVTGGPQNCLLDIVVAIDASGSTGNPGQNTNTLADAELTWLQTFVDDPSIQAALTAGTMQIGFLAWANGSQNWTPGGLSMQQNVTGAQARTWFQNNWSNQNGIGQTTNPQNARNQGLNLLNNKAASAYSTQYPARQNNPFFRQVLIVVTDGNAITAGNNPITPQSFNCCQSSNVIPGAGGPINQELMSVFVGANSSQPGNSTILDQITVGAGAGPATAYYNPTTQTPGPNQFLMNASVPATLTATAQAVAGQVCAIPFNCSCPTGYELVYLNSATGFYDAPTGECTDQSPPICRRVECECPTPPTGTTTTLLGTCPDVMPELAFIGDPNWIDPTPPLCNFYYYDSTNPNYEVGSIWRHNVRCDLFANYYSVSYPWEIELISNTGQAVNTIRSIEYQLESYVYKGEAEYNMCGGDKWEDLNYNFDRAIIYNNEQVSGLLNIEMTPYNDPWNELNYPIIQPNSMTVLSSKVEQKFRINQFWDITNDRGEFSNAQQAVFDTECNGYIRPLNQTNLNYLKPATQHKKFRHYSNHVLLRRQESNNRKMLLRLENTKLLLSRR